MNEKGLKNFTGVVICKNGELMYREWVSAKRCSKTGEIKKEGYYSVKKVTKKLPYYLYSACAMEKGATLRDLFKLCDKHRDFLAPIYEKHRFLEVLDKGLSAPPSKIKNKGVKIKGYDWRWQMYELRTFVEVTKEYTHMEDEYFNLGNLTTGETHGVLLHKKGQVKEDSVFWYNDFTGASFPLTQKDFENAKDIIACDEDDVVRYSGLYTALQKTMDLPLVLNTELVLKVEYSARDTVRTSAERGVYFRLGEVINEVFYEVK